MKSWQEYSKDFCIKNPNYHKEYRDRNNEKINNYNKQWVLEHKDCWKNYHMLKRYGISIEQYNEIFIKQDGKCIICNRHQSEFKKALSIDHNHITGKVRGLLCGRCNSILGYIKEDKEILKNALIYLNKS